MQNAHSNWVVQAHDLSLTFPGATKSAPPVQALRHIDMQGLLDKLSVGWGLMALVKLAWCVWLQD